MNFYETATGNQFFTHQLPQLIKALQDIAAGLPQSMTPMKLSLATNPNILSDLYWGNYEPSVFQKNVEDSKLDAAVMSTRAALMEALPAEAEERFEAYQAATDARTSAVVERSFESGYSTAVQMIFAGLAVPEENRVRESEEP